MIAINLYGVKEHAYASAFADALCEAPLFLSWVLGHTPFAERVGVRVLREEMTQRRPKAKFWWKNFYTEKCRCTGCSGSETDVFVVLADSNNKRFALHVEVKQPTDRFNPSKHQGERYHLRAACWVKQPPARVVAHDQAATLLLCSESKVSVFASELKHFDALLTFEMMSKVCRAAVPA